MIDPGAMCSQHVSRTRHRNNLWIFNRLNWHSEHFNRQKYLVVWHWRYRINQNDFRFSLCNLMTFVMLNHKAFEFLSNTVGLVRPHFFRFRHETRRGMWVDCTQSNLYQTSRLMRVLVGTNLHGNTSKKWRHALYFIIILFGGYLDLAQMFPEKT